MQEHSKHFEEVKGYYDAGLWNANRVRAAVGKWITEAEYMEIMGEAYDRAETEEQNDE